MQERDTQEAPVSSSSGSSYPSHGSQSQDNGWMMTLKIVFWLLLLPTAVLLLFRWLMPA